MKIKDVMNVAVGTVSPDTVLFEVARTMEQHPTGCVLVSEGDRLVGMITEQDLAIRCVAESHLPAATTAKQVMTTEILYCHDTDETEVTARRMAQDKLRLLVVLNAEKRMVGTVTLGNLALSGAEPPLTENDPKKGNGHETDT